MLDAAPEPFDEDVVERSPPSIPADDNAFTLQHTGEGVAVEYRRRQDGASISLLKISGLP